MEILTKKVFTEEGKAEEGVKEEEERNWDGVALVRESIIGRYL